MDFITRTVTTAGAMLVWPETSLFPWKHQKYTDLLNMFIYMHFIKVCTSVLKYHLYKRQQDTSFSSGRDSSGGD